MYDYPEEIRESPRPVAVFIGCTTLHPHIIKNLSTRKELLHFSNNLNENGIDYPNLHIISAELTDLPQCLCERRKERRNR
jgi:hypothetical protein